MINDKLLAIQSELKAPKGQYNSFGKYRYRSCEDILEAVKPLLAKNGCTLTLSDSIDAAGDRVYIKASATLRCGEESITNTAFAREDESKKGMDGSQITGTASSYARKYALNGLFCIDDTKDADTDEYTARQKEPEHPKWQQEPKTVAYATPEQIERIKTLAEEKGTDAAKMLTYYHAESIETMKKSAADLCIEALEKKVVQK